MLIWLTFRALRPLGFDEFHLHRLLQALLEESTVATMA